MTLTWVHWELAIVGIFFPIVAFFLFLMKQYYAGKKNTVIGHLTFVLAILWLGFLLKTIPDTWEVIEFHGLLFPPLEAILDIVVAGYIVGILWNLWWGQKDVVLTG